MYVRLSNKPTVASVWSVKACVGFQPRRRSSHIIVKTGQSSSCTLATGTACWGPRSSKHLAASLGCNSQCISSRWSNLKSARSNTFLYSGSPTKKHVTRSGRSRRNTSMSCTCTANVISVGSTLAVFTAIGTSLGRLEPYSTLTT